MQCAMPSAHIPQEGCSVQDGRNTEMKIAMFGHKCIPSRSGGVEIVVQELSTRMAERGHQVTCYNRSGKSAQTQTQYGDVRLRTVPTIKFRGLAAVTSSFFASLACCASDAKIVHIHAEGPGAMCWLPRLFGKRIIVTVHGLDWKREKWKRGPGRWYIRWGEKMAVRFAHEIIVLNRDQQHYFREVYSRETVYIPNGATPAVRREAAQITSRYGLHPGEYILYLGRLVPEKGVHHLIGAWKLADIPGKLVIAGASSDTDAYVRELEKQTGGDPRILFTGFVQEEILEELYSNAWIYVLPSELEGMPLSLLEAMSYGNCCVHSDIPECTEATQDKAVSFPKGDVSALQDCLRKLCDNPTLVANYKAQASDYICSQYSWDTTTDKTLALYREIGK